MREIMNGIKGKVGAAVFYYREVAYFLRQEKPFAKSARHENLNKLIYWIRVSKFVVHFVLRIMKKEKDFPIGAYVLNKKALVISSHRPDSGLFSSSRRRLRMAVSFFNKHGKPPGIVDCTHLYRGYSLKPGVDPADTFFKKENTSIQYTRAITLNAIYESRDYREIPFEDVLPFVEKYFTPAPGVENLVRRIETKYRLMDYADLCAVYYRGTDKGPETELPGYTEFLQKARAFRDKHPGVRFLLQSDEAGFLEAGLSLFPDAVVFKDENIAREWEPYSNFEHAVNLLAIVVIMSKCGYVICTSGNVSFWIALYRGSAENMLQYLDGKYLGEDGFL